MQYEARPYVRFATPLAAATNDVKGGGARAVRGTLKGSSPRKCQLDRNAIERLHNTKPPVIIYSNSEQAPPWAGHVLRPPSPKSPAQRFSGKQTRAVRRNPAEPGGRLSQKDSKVAKADAAIDAAIDSMSGPSPWVNGGGDSVANQASKQKQHWEVRVQSHCCACCVTSPGLENLSPCSATTGYGGRPPQRF